MRQRSHILYVLFITLCIGDSQTVGAKHDEHVPGKLCSETRVSWITEDFFILFYFFKWGGGRTINKSKFADAIVLNFVSLKNNLSFYNFFGYTYMMYMSTHKHKTCSLSLIKTSTHAIRLPFCWTLFSGSLLSRLRAESSRPCIREKKRMSSRAAQGDASTRDTESDARASCLLFSFSALFISGGVYWSSPLIVGCSLV